MRRFGVEIECLIPIGRWELAQRLNEAGVPASEEGYGHATRAYWKVTVDGSLNVRGYGWRGCEVVSPVLRTKKHVEELRKVCEVLTEVGAKVNKSCGLHVHVNFAGNGPARRAPKDVLRLLKLYSWYEADVIDLLMPKSRRENRNSYCHSSIISAYHLRNVEEARNVSQISYRAQHGSRYRKLNLESYGRYGTMEFRQHGGTIEFDKVWNWVQVCQAMVRFAIGVGNRDKDTGRWVTHKPEDVFATQPDRTLESFCRLLELPADVVEYLYKRYNSFARAERRPRVTWVAA